MRRFNSLQAIRGVAASIVVAMHLMEFTASHSNVAWVYLVAAWLRNVGYIGVDLFFVLSGIVITKVAIKSASHNPKSSLVFLLHRAFRVLPLFWLTLIVMLAIPTMPGVDNSLQTFLLKPSSIILLRAPVAHPVTWTLTYEVQFYIVTAALMLFGRNSARVFVIWIAAEVVLVLVSYAGIIPRIPITDALALEFSMGVLIGLFGVRLQNPWPVATILIAAAAGIVTGWFLGASWVSINTPVRTIVWGLPSATAIWSVMSLEQTGVSFPRWLTGLGDISYSIYMWHLACIAIVNAVFVRVSILHEPYHVNLFITVSVAVILIVSSTSFRFFERPIMKILSLNLRDFAESGRLGRAEIASD